MEELKAVRTARRMGAILICALAMLAATFAGPAAQAITADKALEVMKLTGLDKAFDNVGASIAAGTKRSVEKLESDPSYRQKVLAGLEPAAAAAFFPEKMRDGIRAALESKLDEADYSAVLAFYKTPLGMRMTALENAAHTPEAIKELQEKAGSLLEMLKNDAERVAVLQTLELALGLTDLSINVAFNMARAINLGMAAADQKTESLNDEAIKKIDEALAKLRPALAAQMKQSLWLVMAYTYRDASVAELRDYVKFCSTPAGQKLYRTVTDAMNTVLSQAGNDFGRALAKELGKEHT